MTWANAKIKRILVRQNWVEKQVRPDKMPWYQEVEYIQSSGTQWIDTLHQHTANSKVELKFSYQSMSTKYNLLFWSRSRYTVNDAFSIFIENSSSIALTIWWKVITPASTLANTIYNISFSKDYFIINWSTTTLNSSLTSYWYNDLLFNFMENWQSISWCNPISAKVYYCRIYEWSTLVRDFVPCYRKSDSVIGMYDLVNKQFYTNVGTWTFAKWPDVN